MDRPGAFVPMRLFVLAFEGQFLMALLTVRRAGAVTPYLQTIGPQELRAQRVHLAELHLALRHCLFVAGRAHRAL